ncbi:hypothetical protein CERZMDRAFT_97816 [Cercospora zeae-maydis SCOH1-5]|uniref:Uncharacterized protein n=1 Tax=Cercospora zeae-maydis SCOH1-5 TaxID=717836 RepID=A0A6A6FEM9_9PEZI|nr:hypothetical protein CERZMDRAFT_97816 [Cercospora zeae-maydis SCOH1-5]
MEVPSVRPGNTTRRMTQGHDLVSSLPLWAHLGNSEGPEVASTDIPSRAATLPGLPTELGSTIFNYLFARDGPLKVVKDGGTVTLWREHPERQDHAPPRHCEAQVDLYTNGDRRIENQLEVVPQGEDDAENRAKYCRPFSVKSPGVDANKQANTSEGKWNRLIEMSRGRPEFAIAIDALCTHRCTVLVSSSYWRPLYRFLPTPDRYAAVKNDLLCSVAIVNEYRVL